jgi:hypothetical protein
MKTVSKIVTPLGTIWLISLCMMGLQPAWADDCNISTTSPNYYAWSENVGWTNWHASYACVSVAPTYLVGYVWAENIGWIKLGSTPPYHNTTSANWGVNRNSGTGALSGYAWSENVGWINFNVTADNPGGVSMNTSTGKFDGYAWAENVGYIHFQNSTDYYVEMTGPLVVDLVSFTAQGVENHMLLKWETASEMDNAGFHIWRRKTKVGTYSKITQTPIPAEGGATSGATYTYNDTDVTPPQAWYYKLEDISNAGASTFHGPVLGVVGDAAVKVVDGSTTIGVGDMAQGMGEIIIEGTGQHTVTTGRYADNPVGAPTFSPTGDYWFVDVTDLSGLNSVTIRFCPAESNNTVYYWDGGNWIKCSQQEYTDRCIAVMISSSTSPQISDLSMLIFALSRGSSTAIPTLSEWGMIVFCLLLMITAIVVMRRRRFGLKSNY